MTDFRKASLPWMIVGAGGHARSVFDVICRNGELLAGVYAAGRRPDWLPDECVMRTDEELGEVDRAVRWVVAIGDSTARRRLSRRLMDYGHELGTMVASTATVAAEASLAAGVMVLEHAHVGPGARVGMSTIVNTSAVVEHDCQVGEFTHVAPRAVILGGGHVGSGVLIGAGSVVLSHAQIADGVTLGAGAVATRSVVQAFTMVGVPARQVGT